MQRVRPLVDRPICVPALTQRHKQLTLTTRRFQRPSILSLIRLQAMRYTLQAKAHLALQTMIARKLRQRRQRVLACTYTHQGIAEAPLHQ